MNYLAVLYPCCWPSLRIKSKAVFGSINDDKFRLSSKFWSWEVIDTWSISALYFSSSYLTAFSKSNLRIMTEKRSCRISEQCGSKRWSKSPSLPDPPTCSSCIHFPLHWEVKKFMQRDELNVDFYVWNWIQII